MAKSHRIFSFVKSHNNFFYLENGDGLAWKTHRYRLDFYLNGLSARGQQIGKTYLLDFIDFLDDDIIIDCGANMGDLQLYFLSKSIRPVYYGFEPNPQDFLCASKNLIFEGQIFDHALWKSDEEIVFFPDTKFASGSIIRPKGAGEPIPVKAKRLDSYSEFSTVKKIKLLKLEGEGAEPEILEGSIGILNRIQFIAADVGPERGILELSTEEEVSYFLIKNGFEIVNRNPFHRRTLLYRNRNLL